MVRLEYYWHSNEEWYHWDDELYDYVVNDSAPKEAKESYLKYLKQLEDIDKRTTRSFVIPKTQREIEFYYENDPDWDRGTYENEDIIVYNIPYEEFCIMRAAADISDFLSENDLQFMRKEDIEKYINVLIEKNLQVPKTLEILNRALSYNTYIDYVEENIL